IHLIRENSIMTTNNIERAAKHWGVILTEITDNLQEPYAERALFTYLLKFLLFYKICATDDVYDVLYKRFQYQLYVYHYFLLNISLFLYKLIPILSIRKIFLKILNYSAIYYLKHKY
ncbi:MAG: hypothetical protein LUC91_04520, partial [Prevotella sp.]|nr:hypothetical protein [Prevotella sp.]